MNNLTIKSVEIELYDQAGRLVERSEIFPGSTISYVDTRRLYSGDYILRIHRGTEVINRKVTVVK